MHCVLILGGYGNFGKRIAHALVKAGVPVIIAGRNRDKAEALTAALGELAQAAVFDANAALDAQLQALKPAVVVNTCGPFQNADYRIAESCIRHGVHYIDLADGREFVTGISTLDASAKAAGVAVISGASSVPGLSSAVVEHFRDEFAEIDEMIFGISPGQQAERGPATTRGVLSYVGKPLKPYAGHPKPYGWQNLYRQDYPELGKRWLANCDVPDLDLLPERYGIKSIRFSAGLELAPLHLGLWALSWLVRAGLPLHLPAFSGALLQAANWFDRFGSADGGMHVILRGKGVDGAPHERRWFIIARDGSGPHIPTVPAIVLAKKLAASQTPNAGAQACVGLVSLAEYMAYLEAMNIVTVT
ncbi:MAG: saccharopine dehydrogenase [Rickettsiales bacterium]|nr:saccharopine dehydrogenase [Rickettsiales bacterium]